MMDCIPIINVSVPTRPVVFPSRRQCAICANPMFKLSYVLNLSIIDSQANFKLKPDTIMSHIHIGYLLNKSSIVIPHSIVIMSCCHSDHHRKNGQTCRQEYML